MRILKTLIYSQFILLFLGCATIFKGSKPNVVFSVTGAEGANISVYELANNSEKKLTNGQSGFNFPLKTGAGYFKKAKYKVKVKQGRKKVEKILEPKLNLGWYIGGNVIIGGPITGLVGYLIVDPLTGAMWDFDLDNKDQVNLDFEKESVVDESEPEDVTCDFFNQTVTLKNKEVLKNVVMGIIPGYVVVFTQEGKTWVYPKSEVKGAENANLSETSDNSKVACDFFSQTVSLKKGEVIKDTIATITPEFVVVLKKEGRVIVYPKSEVLNIKNK